MPQRITTSEEYLREFQERIGKRCDSLSDLNWDEVQSFLNNIPTDIEQIDFLRFLTKLPDDGVVNSIVVDPARHNRNQNALLRPLRNECNRLLSKHFDLESILHQAEQIADHADALAYLWSVLRDYTKYHPTIRQNAYQPEELAFCTAIKSEIQHRKDLHEASSVSRQSHFNVTGDVAMGDIYKAGQAGAIGPNAHAHDMTFNQMWNQLQNSVDLSQLASELAMLRQEMKREAIEPEHDIAVAEIARAEQSAKEGNGSKTLEHLKSAGKWALDVGTKIGTSLAVEVLKEATGLKHSQ